METEGGTDWTDGDRRRHRLDRWRQKGQHGVRCRRRHRMDRWRQKAAQNRQMETEGGTDWTDGDRRRHRMDRWRQKAAQNRVCGRAVGEALGATRSPKAEGKS